MFAILWAVVAMLAAGASVVLTLDATTRVAALRTPVRAIDAEPGRPGLRDGDLAERLGGHPVPAAVTVTAGFRRGTTLLAAATVGLLLTLGALLTESGVTVPVATASLALSAYIGLRYGNARRLHADRDRIRLRRWRTSADIPRDAVRGVGFVPDRDGGRIWIALWCDPEVVSRLPEALTDSATVNAGTGWLRLDAIETVSTVQLLRLWQNFADRWMIGDENGTVHPAPPDLSRLFATADRFGFDATGRYSVDGVRVGHVVHRKPSRPTLWRARLTRTVERLPHTFEVRDSLLRTRWLISKPDAAWKTAFYVTDRHGHRVGTLRAVSAVGRNFDLCGTDNRVLATLRPGRPRTTVVDTGGKPIAVWDLRTGDLFSDADPSLRPLCLLSPIVARFTGTATGAGAGNSGPETQALAAEPTATSDDETAPVDDESASPAVEPSEAATVPLTAAEPTAPQPDQPPSDPAAPTVEVDTSRP